MCTAFLFIFNSIQVIEEIKKLEEAKEVAEGELEARVPPLNTALQCLTLRERRREGDLVKDEVEVLHKHWNCKQLRIKVKYE